MVDSEYPTLVDRQTGNTIVINTNPFSLGRGLGCSYVISNKVISRTHCVLEKHGDTWFLQDTSTNGTYLNDKLIKSMKSPPLCENSIITLDLGDHSYVFHLPKTNGVSMDDITDEQLCMFADTVLNEGGDVNVPDTASNHPLHDNMEMVKSQENHHINKKPKVGEPATSLMVVDVADTSTKSEISLPPQPGPSTDVNVAKPQGVPQPLREPVKDNYEVMENELQCAICSELFIKAVTLNCAHTFCKYCIELWKKTKLECPICRARITSETATLVLDNVIQKVVESSSDEAREHRKQILQEREKLEQAKTEKANSRRGRRTRRSSRSTRTGGGSTRTGGGSARRGSGRANVRRNRRNSVTRNVGNIVHPVIELSSDSETDSDWESGSEISSISSGDGNEWREEYDNDEWYEGGVPGAYYGGYGYCFSCGRQGHWANGCPFR